MLLPDALRVLLVLLNAEPDCYPPARFAGSRLVAERRLSLEVGQLVYAALQGLAWSDPLPGGAALETVLEGHAEHEAARHLGDWLRQRGG